jgi:hypothetical protein
MSTTSYSPTGSSPSAYSPTVASPSPTSPTAASPTSPDAGYSPTDGDWTQTPDGGYSTPDGQNITENGGLGDDPGDDDDGWNQTPGGNFTTPDGDTYTPDGDLANSSPTNTSKGGGGAGGGGSSGGGFGKGSGGGGGGNQPQQKAPVTQQLPPKILQALTNALNQSRSQTGQFIRDPTTGNLVRYNGDGTYSLYNPGTGGALTYAPPSTALTQTDWILLGGIAVLGFIALRKK